MIVLTVLFTVLLIEDCVDEPGVETLIPLGNLSDDFPEKPLTDPVLFTYKKTRKSTCLSFPAKQTVIKHIFQLKTVKATGA